MTKTTHTTPHSITRTTSSTPTQHSRSRMGHAPLASAMVAVTCAGLLMTSAGGCKAIQRQQERKAQEREAEQLREMQAASPETLTENQSANQSISQPISQPANRPAGQPTAQTPNERNTQSEWIQQQRPRETNNQTAQTTAGDSLDKVVMEIVDDRPSASSTQSTPRSVNAGDQANEPLIDLPAPKTTEEQSLARAVELYASGDLESALRELERAIAINPRFTRAYIELGDIYMEMAEYDLAERKFAAAVRNEPRNYLAQYRHANVLHKLGALDESKRAYLRALSIRPSAFDANLGLSQVQLESGTPEQALSYAQRAVRADPQSGRARMHLGNVHAALDQHEQAIIEYQQAADVFDQPGTGLLLNMADSLNQLQRYAEMVGVLEQMVLVEPDTLAYERLGSGYFRLRRYDEALVAFNSSANLDPNHFPALNGIAVCELNNYLWNGKVDGGARERAVDAMRRSLRLERQQPRIVELLRRYSQPAGSEQ
ncbi:MAG: tetratricopeptide repeat protein [Phycisphaerales bacterium]